MALERIAYARLTCDHCRAVLHRERTLRALRRCVTQAVMAGALFRAGAGLYCPACWAEQRKPKCPTEGGR